MTERMTLQLRVTVAVEPDGAGFHAFTPGLKGLHADGDTESEALQNIVAALPAYMESLAKHGDPLPVGPDWPSLQTSNKEESGNAGPAAAR